MSNIWFTSDTHFGHLNTQGTGIIDYCKRPFSSIKEMDEALINNWNQVVQPGDLVYHLGDLAFVNSIKDLKKYVNKLNGQIIWVAGNHDYLLFDNNGNLSQSKIAKVISEVPKIAKVCDRLLLKINDEEISQQHKQKIVLSHYPMFRWDSMGYGSWHLFGHVHGTLGYGHFPQALDVGVDINNFTPVSYNQIKTRITQRVMGIIEEVGPKPSTNRNH